MDAYPLSIKAAIDESQLRNHAQAEFKAADNEKSDEEIKAYFMAATGHKTCAYELSVRSAEFSKLLVKHVHESLIIQKEWMIDFETELESEWETVEGQGI